MKRAPVLTIDTSEPLQNSAEGFGEGLGAEILEVLQQWDTFEGVLAHFGVVTKCAAIVASPGNHVSTLHPFTDQWIARDVLERINAARACIKSGDSAGGAAHALWIGLRLAQAKEHRTRSQHQHAGRARGVGLSKLARGRNTEIAQCLQRWKISDELQAQFRSPTAYIASRLQISQKTVRRHMTKLARGQ